MKKVFEVGAKFTLDAEKSAEVLDTIWEVWGDEPPEWLVGIETMSEGEPRVPTDEECETMAWEKQDAE